MTQEEKLEEAKRLYETANADQKYVLESLFPELKESEDERIINNIKKVIGWYRGMFTEKSLMPEQYQEINAWLEEQGKITKEWSEMKFNNIQTELQEMVDLKQIRKNLQDNSFRRMLEQKPAWSEDDEKMRTRCAAFLGYHYQGGMMTRKEYKEVHNWLESLKDRVLPQPMQEWSEEDKKMLKEIISDVKFEGYNNDMQANSYKKINWLKSLKDRYTWKPTEAQMKALLYASSVLSDYDSTLTELYNDLKKLKGEE